MAGEELIGAGILAILRGMLVFVIILFGLIYIYTSLAFMAIAKKAKLDSPGLAWIPGVGPLIIAFQTSKMHWWPWLLLLSLLIIGIPIIGIIVYFIAIMIFGIYTIIWQWKMFEAVKKPGWWAILCIISPLNLIFWGIAAWSKK
jgi:hypothetical protein